MKAFPHKGKRTVFEKTVGTGTGSLGTKEVETNEPGMDLRDYFAAKAMQPLVAKHGNNWERTIAKQAYKQADEMMEARK